MPQDLPGFYYDEEKNRYFPIRGPIPGTSNRKRLFSGISTVSNKLENPSNTEAKNENIGAATRTSKLIQDRELNGKVILSNKRRHNFQEEVRNRLASQPMVWKYQQISGTCDSALEMMHIDKDTSSGRVGINVLLAASSSCLSLLEVEQIGQSTGQRERCIPERAWPLKTGAFRENREPGPICSPPCSTIAFSSDVSSVKRLGSSSGLSYDVFSIRKSLYPESTMHFIMLKSSVLEMLCSIILKENKFQQIITHTLTRDKRITTLGSGDSCGFVYLLDLDGELDFSIPDFTFRMHKVASIDKTIWSSHSSPDGKQAVVGTNQGSLLINVEAGLTSWICRTKSDVFSQQFDKSGNKVLCGLRNGAILTVDIRQRQQGSSMRLPTKHISFPAGTNKPKNFTTKGFECKGNVDTSVTTFMPSSISSLVALQSYDHYFLASSMDGSIRLYDHRNTKRGHVQSYEGHVNSQTRIQLGIDPSETFLMSGGEDCCLRIWNIKTGKLLFGDKFMNSVPRVVCWPRMSNPIYENSDSWDAWLGSEDGLFVTHLT